MKKFANKHINYMNLPYHFKLLRTLNKHDIGYIAKYCKTTKRRVWAWEKGLAEPTLWQLECLTVLFDTSMDLICGTMQSSKLIANQAITDREVTVEELMLIRLYRELSKNTQDLVKHLIENRFLEETEKNEKMLEELQEVRNSHDPEKLWAFLQKYKKAD